MNYRLTIHPLIDSAKEAYVTMFFESKEEMFSASTSCAELLLFLHQLGVMNDESNVFISEQFVDNKWIELD